MISLIDKIIKDLKRVIHVQDKEKFLKQNIPYYLDTFSNEEIKQC